MTTIGGPGGIGGPAGPGRPDGPPAIAEPAGDPPVDAAGAAGAAPATDLDALAADIAAGRLSAREAIDRLVEAAGGGGLDAAERAELRELFNDLIANDPHLGDLIGRI
jgi:hypothetical protein